MSKVRLWEFYIFDEYFQDIESGIKKFDIRKYNKDYKIGDIANFTNDHTGKEITKRIIYINHTIDIYQTTNLSILGLGDIE